MLFHFLVPVLSAALLGSCVVSSELWIFIPVGLCLLCRWNFKIGLIYLIFCLLLAFFLGEMASAQATQLDKLALILLFVAGLMLFHLQSKQGLFLKRGLGIYFCLSALLVAGLMLLRFSLGGEQGVNHWTQIQMGSDIFPAFFGAKAWPEDLKNVYESFLQPLFRISLLSWFAVSLAVGLLFNLFLLRLFHQLQWGGQRNRRFWLQFSRWRAPDWILLPLVLGLGFLAYSNQNLFPAGFSLSPWLGWNLTVLALFPAFMNGMSLYAYLIPRLPFFILILVLIVLIINPLQVLVLSGLADLWFDFRRRLETRPKSGSQ